MDRSDVLRTASAPPTARRRRRHRSDLRIFTPCPRSHRQWSRRHQAPLVPIIAPQVELLRGMRRHHPAEPHRKRHDEASPPSSSNRHPPRPRRARRRPRGPRPRPRRRRSSPPRPRRAPRDPLEHVVHDHDPGHGPGVGRLHLRVHLVEHDGCHRLGHGRSSRRLGRGPRRHLDRHAAGHRRLARAAELAGVALVGLGALVLQARRRRLAPDRR